MAARVSPSHLYPLVRAFLATNGFASTVVAFDKELGANKVTSQVEGDLFEICKEYLKAHPIAEPTKRKAEDDSTEKPNKKAKVEKEEKEDKKDKKSKKEESSDESSDDSSDSDSDSSSSDSSDSESSSSSSDSSDSESDSSSDSSSDSDSSSSDSDSSSSEDEKAKKKEKKDKKDKKEKKETNGKDATPSTPAANGNGVAPVTPASAKKNTPFKRVTEEDAVYLTDRFADNTFESKKGDAFGAKANEILSQVRGKGFRTEKGKKKKSYRAGAGTRIDLGVNSVKFVYDD